MTTQTENRLANASSPYLKQHAFNPVDWYPWGGEAIKKAREEKKPMLLSIGYATCHWCHVMAGESFADPVTADLMNRYFVSIKVDREERPDLDAIYMQAVVAMTGQGGWPLNVFLDPETLNPFFGGTYFPKSPKHMMGSWKQVLERIAALWGHAEKREELLRQGEKLRDYLTKWADPCVSDADPAAIDPDLLIAQNREILNRMHDDENGGFGRAPKFPTPPLLTHMLRISRLGGTDASLGKKALFTLTQIANGGIFDHLEGGFHRYAVDSSWQVPHFEKMLYDNAQLASLYLDACEVRDSRLFRTAAQMTLDYMIRSLKLPEGGFAAAEDADSGEGHEKTEGAFYVWTYEEIQAVLPEPHRSLWNDAFGVKKDGNVAASFGAEFKDRNIFSRKKTDDALAAAFSFSEDQVRSLLSEAAEMLTRVRAKRIRPDRDDKVILSWNGLAIQALVKGSDVLDHRYLDPAVAAAHFVKTHMMDDGTGELYRSWCAGRAEIPAVAEDYAELILGLLDLYAATASTDWLDWVTELVARCLDQFVDAEKGIFYHTPEGHDGYLIVRMSDMRDSVMPSPAGRFALGLYRAGQILGRNQWLDISRRILRTGMARYQNEPVAIPALLDAVHLIGLT
ncbi:MAG: thioredoxin domain-containing protein [Deltaproteobacteria bacterium]|nr:MAG: thioredoxin domain-containing protein [Deltaproteobacteria bacterium]